MSDPVVPQSKVDAVIGEINTSVPTSGLYKAPAPEVLAAFPAPPPIAPPPIAPPPLAPPPPAQGTPDHLVIQPSAPADRFTALGVTVGSTPQQPVFTEPPPPLPPPLARSFDDLPPHTQHEMRRGFREIHRGERFQPSEWHMPPEQVQAIEDAPPEDSSEPELDLSKLSSRTLREMQAGKARIDKVAQDYKAVIALQKERAAKALEAGEPPKPDALSYRG